MGNGTIMTVLSTVINNQLFLEPKWAIDSEAMTARGILL